MGRKEKEKPQVSSSHGSIKAQVLLRAQHWAGRLMIEMWNDDAPDSVARCIDAREFIEDRAASAGIPVLAP